MAKADKIAHDIAIKARNQHVREAAKLRVRAQNLERTLKAATKADDFTIATYRDEITEALAAADAKEVLAREWDHKARLALGSEIEPYAHVAPYGRTEHWVKNGQPPDAE
jgi:hypothetical protein